MSSLIRIIKKYPKLAIIFWKKIALHLGIVWPYFLNFFLKVFRGLPQMALNFWPKP